MLTDLDNISIKFKKSANPTAKRFIQDGDPAQSQDKWKF